MATLVQQMSDRQSTAPLAAIVAGVSRSASGGDCERSPAVREAQMKQTQAKKKLTLEVQRDYRKAFKEICMGSVRGSAREKMGRD